MTDEIQRAIEFEKTKCRWCRTKRFENSDSRIENKGVELTNSWVCWMCVLRALDLFEGVKGVAKTLGFNL